MKIVRNMRGPLRSYNEVTTQRVSPELSCVLSIKYREREEGGGKDKEGRNEMINYLICVSQEKQVMISYQNQLETVCMFVLNSNDLKKKQQVFICDAATIKKTSKCLLIYFLATD